MKHSYRILEREWSNNKKDYIIQEYSKKWYSKKYKWRTVKQIISSLSGTWKRDATFSSKEEAEKYLKEVAKCVINEQVVEEYLKSEEK